MNRQMPRRLSVRALAGRFRFVTDCIGSTFEDIRDLIDNGDRAISMRTFAIAIGPDGWRQLSAMLGYNRYFPLSRDWHVGYYRGIFRAVPAVYMRHSAIEYIFTLDGRVGPSASPPGRAENGGYSLLARHNRA